MSENARFEAAVGELGAFAADLRRPEFINGLSLRELVQAERLASEAIGILAHLKHLRGKWLKTATEEAGA